jgi:hypothetical protein
VGKKAAGPATPSPADYRKQAEQYWGNYGQWTADETARYEKDMARVRATQGAANGPNMSGVFADKRQKEYEARMQELKGGEHGKFLTDYYNEAMKDFKKPLSTKAQRELLGKMGADIPERMYSEERTSQPKGKYGFTWTDEMRNQFGGKKPTMEEFYSKSFGAQKAEGMSSEEQAKQRARMAGGRQRTGAGGGAGGAGTVSTATTSFGLAPQEEKTTWW